MSNQADSRRRLFVRLLAAGAMGLVPGVPGAIRSVLAMGHLPEMQGMQRLQGDVRINGSAAQMGSLVKFGDAVTTGAASHAVFVMGRDAFLLRENSRAQFDGAALSVKLLRLATGKLLSVFGQGAHRIETGVATIGIRGTGIYVEAQSQRSYVCTCYGVIDLASRSDPRVRETVETTHHDAPRYVYADNRAARIELAPVIDHSDAELIMLESLVGRIPPFVGRLGESDYY